MHPSEVKFKILMNKDDIDLQNENLSVFNTSSKA